MSVTRCVGRLIKLIQFSFQLYQKIQPNLKDYSKKKPQPLVCKQPFALAPHVKPYFRLYSRLTENIDPVQFDCGKYA
jgi:hypothetical protein